MVGGSAPPVPGRPGSHAFAQAQSKASFPGWLAGPVSVGLGAVAHLVSGGPVPAVTVLLALTALVSMAATLASRFMMPSWLLLTLSGLLQQLLHLSFELLAGVPGSGSSTHAHSIVWAPPPSDGLSAAADNGYAAHMMEVMLVTHVAAALLTTLVLAKAGSFLRRFNP